MKRISLYLGLLLSGFTHAVPAYADWQPLDDSATSFIDGASFRSTGRNASIWVMENLAQPQEFPQGTAKSKLSYLEADCQQYQIRTLAYNYRADLLGKGKELDSMNPSYGVKSARWRWVAPDSLDQRVFNRLCLKPKPKLEVPAPPAAEIEPVAAPKVENSI